MLKLLKHDIKDSYLEIVILNGILIVLSLFLMLGVATQSVFLLFTGIFAWGSVFIAIFVMLVITIIKSFHKKLFTDCGYLTLTTPVSVDKILISKILVSMLWFAVTIISVVICALLILAGVSNLIFSESGGSFSLLGVLLLLIVDNPFGFFKAVMIGLTSILSFITTLIFILALINAVIRMKKFKTLIGILIYIAVYTVMSMINNPIFGAMNKLPNLAFVINVLLNLGWSAAFYFTSRYLIIRKLELE